MGERRDAIRTYREGVEAEATSTETNWAGNLSYEATQLHQPTSIDEAQELVASLPRVRAVGTRHSFNPIADSPGGALLSLGNIPLSLEIDETTATAVVPAALSYGRAAAALDAEGWALDNMGSLPHISLAGAMATGTHGSGDDLGILSASIRGMELITADGSIRTIGPDEPDLAALAVGLGRFGVITRLRLAVQPSYQMRQDVYRGAPWDTVLERFDEVMASAYSVCVIGRYESPTIDVIILKSRIDAAGGHSAPERRFGGVWDPDPRPSGHHTERAGRPGPWFERLPHFRPDLPPSVGGDELQSEYFVPRRHSIAAIEAMRSMGDRIAPHLWATEIRTVAGDELWASAAYQRDSLCIGFTWKQHPDEVDALMLEVEEALEPFDPRPHWGKLFRLEDLGHRFPELHRHRTLAMRYDPAGRFESSFLDGTF